MLCKFNWQCCRRTSSYLGQV